MSDEIGIKEGNADFEGVGHAGTIHLHQDALLKIKFRAQVEDTFQTPRKAAAVGKAGDVLEGIVAMELLAGIGGEEIVALAIPAGSHPKKEADFGGKTEPFQKLGHEKRKAFVVVGNGEALDQMIDGDTDANGEEGEAFDEEVSLETGISREKFVSPVATENGFYFSGCQTGEEPGWNEGGIPQRFIQSAVDGGQGLRNIFWCQGLVVVLRAHLAGDHFGEGKFVVGGLLKADREGVKFLLGQRSGEGGDSAGVDPSAEEDSDFHITSELVADSFAKKFAGCLRRFVKGASTDGVVLDRKVIKIFGSATRGGPG